MKAQRMSLDKFSSLPPSIIETILCLLPIHDAARTSILSKEWRYHWIKIPKLVFKENTFKASENHLSIWAQAFESQPSERLKMSRELKLFYAIYQVLLAHQGPILDFTLSMAADDECVEIDHIINHLSRKYTVKKFSLDLECGSEYLYRVPLSIFSLHQLTDLCLKNCHLDHRPTFNGFNNLTSLYVVYVYSTRETLLHLISKSPLLKTLTLLLINVDHLPDIQFNGPTIIELFESLPVIEHLTIESEVILGYVEDVFPRELPTSLVHLKYFCLEASVYSYNYGLPFLVFMIRSSPNLEKLKLRILPEYLPDFWRSEIDSITMEDFSDIWLKHLNELEIKDFTNIKPELEFVKLILVKSPVLKKVRIMLDSWVSDDEEV